MSYGSAVPYFTLHDMGPHSYAVGKCPQFNNSKIQSELGFKFHSPEAAIKDQVDAMLALGIAKPF